MGAAQHLFAVLEAQTYALVYVVLVYLFLRANGLRSVVIARSDGTVESGVLGDRVLLLVEELAARTVNVDMQVCAGMLIGLHAAGFCAPAEVLRVFGV